MLNLYYVMDKLRLLYGEDKIQRAVALTHSLRGFNPFNGISSSPAALTKADDESTLIPEIKSLNKLFNLKANTKMKSNNQFSELTEAPVNVYEYLLIISPSQAVKNEIMTIKQDFNKAHDHIQAIKSKPH